jgi:hypothetical protein
LISYVNIRGDISVANDKEKMKWEEVEEALINIDSADKTEKFFGYVSQTYLGFFFSKRNKHKLGFTSFIV